MPDFRFDRTVSSAVPAPPEPESIPAPDGFLTNDELAAIDRYWRAANYLTVGQIYLQANPLLREPLRPRHIKPRLLGHWGTSPGLSFIYAHVNRLIRKWDQDAIFLAGPGHGGPAVVANVYLEGTYSEVYPDITTNVEGMTRLFRQFSTPGGIPSHVSATTPGSIHEGGELGYVLTHAFGAVFDNPDLLAVAVVGDGEFETAPLAGSWKSIDFLNPAARGDQSGAEGIPGPAERQAGRAPGPRGVPRQSMNGPGDGIVLPILHLNGYKIANPSTSARLPDAQLRQLFLGYGYEPHFVAGSHPAVMHQAFAAVLDRCYEQIQEVRRGEHRRFPMIVLRSPKGWTGPKQWHGLPIEGTFRAHQVPLTAVRTDPAQLALLEQWMRSYRPDELFDHDGAIRRDIVDWLPRGHRRMGSNPHANGGQPLGLGMMPAPAVFDGNQAAADPPPAAAADPPTAVSPLPASQLSTPARRTIPLNLPDWRTHAIPVPAPAQEYHESTRRLGLWLRDLIAGNGQRFRLFCPDELASNRLQDTLQVTNRRFALPTLSIDDHLAPDGRVLEVLSENLCEGWLEGYLLTGRHGLFATYEAFAMVAASMIVQHTKWLEAATMLPWRAPIASLTLLLTSTCWRQDHNGFSHQGPGLIDVVLSKRGTVARIYFPPDANCLLAVAHRTYETGNLVNLIVIDKQPQLQWLDADAALEHCKLGASEWTWASSGGRDGAPAVPGSAEPQAGRATTPRDPRQSTTPAPGEPGTVIARPGAARPEVDVVLAACGDIPTLEIVAAAWWLRHHLPELRLRVVNVVDLMCLFTPDVHPHGLSPARFEELFTASKHVVFAFHGYQRAVHEVLHGRPNSDRFHVRGFKEQGTTTTPFDMVALNGMSRFDLASAAIRRALPDDDHKAALLAVLDRELSRAVAYSRDHFDDPPEITHWTWTAP